LGAVVLDAVDHRIGLIDCLTAAISDPLFKLAAGRAPLETGNSLACGATHSRLEGSLRRSDIYRTAKALIEQFVATYNEAPGSITLDIDHTDDAAHGQQELTFYNHHYGHYCYLPLLVFEAESGALVTSVLRQGQALDGCRECHDHEASAACFAPALAAYPYPAARQRAFLQSSTEQIVDDEIRV